MQPTVMQFVAVNGCCCCCIAVLQQQNTEQQPNYTKRIFSCKMQKLKKNKIYWNKLVKIHTFTYICKNCCAWVCECVEKLQFQVCAGCWLLKDVVVKLGILSSAFVCCFSFQEKPEISHKCFKKSKVLPLENLSNIFFLWSKI